MLLRRFATSPLYSFSLNNHLSMRNAICFMNFFCHQLIYKWKWNEIWERKKTNTKLIRINKQRWENLCAYIHVRERESMCEQIIQGYESKYDRCLSVFVKLYYYLLSNVVWHQTNPFIGPMCDTHTLTRKTVYIDSLGLYTTWCLIILKLIVYNKNHINFNYHRFL